MVIAFVLMGLILVGWPFFSKKLGFAPPEPVSPVKSSVQSQKAAPQSGTAPPETAAPSAVSETSASSETAASLAAPSETEWALDTNLYHVVFSNRGGVVKSWTLRNFKDSDRKPLELVNQKGAEKAGFPFSFDFRGQKPSADLNKALWVAHPSGDSIEYAYSDGKTVARKSFTFQHDGYMVQYADEVTLNGAGLPHLIQWRAGFGDMAAYSPAGHQASIHYDTDARKLRSEGAKAAKNGPVRADGLFSFAGIEDQYFTAAFLPPPDTQLQTETYSDVVATSSNPSEEAFPGVAIGGGPRNQLGLYVGPKELSSLQKVNPKLVDIIDWGFFGVIAKPLFLILQWMNNAYVHSYGWSIILLTILINIAMFPLKLANLKSMRKMQLLQPELARINDKYKGISMSDPRAANKQQETMDLYQKIGVNPMGGCIPMLMQLPFLWAFYKVLSVTVEMRNAPWLWVADLSQPEHFQIHFLPIIMVATSFLMQKMTPMAGGDPTQQKVMQFMPLMWGVFFWQQSSGLVLYWLTGNLVGIAQQWFFNKTAVPAKVTASSGKLISAKDGKKRT